ncbi:hypothetical protein P9112_008701 [Eukaryota sp. TZLM1-RC]
MSSTPKRPLKPVILPHIQRSPPRTAPPTEPRTPFAEYQARQFQPPREEEIPPSLSIVDPTIRTFPETPVPKPSDPIQYNRPLSLSDRSRDIVYPTETDDSSHWVTVFGFDPKQTSSVLSYLSRVGTIVERSSGAGNFIHVKFGDPVQATSAIALNGSQYEQGSLVGVVPRKDLPVDSYMTVARAGVLPDHPAKRVMIGETERLYVQPKRKPSVISKMSEFLFG